MAPRPRLRPGLDLFSARGGDLILRDPYRYASNTLRIPVGLSPLLHFFEGARDPGPPGGLSPSERRELIQLEQTLRTNGFLDTEEFRALRRARRSAFRDAPVRDPGHSGSAYADEPSRLRAELSHYVSSSDETPPALDRPLRAIAAPHVSPSGGFRSYGSAYRALAPSLRDCTFVVLGTSHYGASARFGLTRKAFRTPYGLTEVDQSAVDQLLRGAGSAIDLEDYCHSIEHSIEFQVIFLQHLFGPQIRIVPILVGPFGYDLRRAPEDNPQIAQFFEALIDLERDRADLFFVLGIDLAHLGERYGDHAAARAHEGWLASIARQDQDRLGLVCAADRNRLRAAVSGGSEQGDDRLRWCGYAVLYTFLFTHPGIRGRLLRYEQWNIDPNSVVSFAGLEFH